MTSNKNENEILSITNKNIRQDLLHFKEEVLKDIKMVQREFSNKFIGLENTLKEQITIYESKVSSFEQTIKNLSNLISSDRSIIQKLEELSQFKEDTNDKLTVNSVKITNLETDYKMNLKNIQSILSSSVIYPGIIGYSGRFKSFHEFMDYILFQIADLITFKDKSTLDLVPYKKKIDDSLEYIKLQVNHIINSSNEFTIKRVNDSEQKFKSLMQLYDDRLQDARVENAHYAVGLEKKSEELSGLIKNIYEVKADIYKKLKDEISNVKGEQKSLLHLFTSYKKEFNSIKGKFIQLSEFIRDVRFRVNIAPDVKKKEFIEMSKKLSPGNSSLSSRKKINYNRADTFDLNKKYSNMNYDFLDFPFNELNNYYPNTFNDNKRSSFQMGNIRKFSNRIINKFDASTNPKEESKNKRASNFSNRLSVINKDISNFESEWNDIFESGGKIRDLSRRNTASLSRPNYFNTDFSVHNQKNVNNRLSEVIKPKKTKEENILNISKSSEEKKDKSKADIEENERKRKRSMQEDNDINKSRFTIKEEDENNMSENTEDNKNQKPLKQSKSSKNEKKIKNKILNLEEAIEINDNKTPKNENIDKNNKEEIIQKKEENKNDIILKNENENEKNKDNNNINIIKENKEKILNNGNNIAAKVKRNNVFSAKILNNTDKANRFQFNKNEPNQREKKVKNRISIININAMFNNNNRVNRHAQFINSPNNLYFAFSQENNFIKHNQTVGNWKSAKNKSNPSLVSKSNKTIINTTSYNYIEKVNTRNNNNKKNIDTIENETRFGNPFKTYSSFPKIKLSDRFEQKPKLNSKVIYLNGKTKKINDIAHNFLNKKIKKIKLNREPYISFKSINSLVDI